MPKLTNEELHELYADDDGQMLVEDIHARKAQAEADADLRARGIEPAPVSLALKEFKSTVLPKQCGTRKVDTWHTGAEVRALWVERVGQYPVMTAITPPEKLRTVFGPGGRVTVAGDVLIDLAAAAAIKIEGLGDDVE